MAEFDLSKYELQDTATVSLKTAEGDDDLIGVDGVNPVTIELYGSGSREAVRAMHRAGEQAQRRLVRAFRGKVNKKEAEDAEQEQIDKLVACTKKINNFPLEPEQLYSNAKLGYIKKQVIRFLDDDANFSPGSSKS